jgi:hypothetical protein
VEAFLNSPVAVAVNSASNTFVADGNSVRQIGRLGTDVVLKTLAGIVTRTSPCAKSNLAFR